MVGGKRAEPAQVVALRLTADELAALDAAFDALRTIGAEQVLIEEMAPAGVDLIVGARRDPVFGPIVLLGIGGTAAEAIGDVVIRSAPLSIETASDMPDELAARELLRGWRGGPVADIDDLDEDATPQPFLDGLTIDPGQDPATTGLVSVDEALRAGLASVHSGSRIGPAPRSATGVRVIDADAVTDPDQPRRGLDPLDLEAIAPRARRTEPGDVVFCVSPTPAAVVDQEGLSVVAYPARIIRCAPDKGLVPEAVAQAINDLPPRAPRWRAWRVPRMPVDQAHSLRAALRRIADEEMRARQRITRLDALAHELMDGVAAGALTITPDPTEEGL